MLLHLSILDYLATGVILGAAIPALALLSDKRRGRAARRATADSLAAELNNALTAALYDDRAAYATRHREAARLYD